MRVLLVTDWVADEGGIETYHRLLRPALEAAGDEVRLLTSSAGSACGGEADYVAYGARRPAAQATLQVVNPAAARSVRRAVREFRPDVAFVSMFEMHLSPAIFPALAGIPIVLNIAYYKPICPTGLKLRRDGSLCRSPAGLVCTSGGCVGMVHWLRDRPRYALIRGGLRRAERTVTCSAWMTRELAAAGISAVHLPPPVAEPSASFTRDAAPEPLLVYSGRLAREKGVGLLLRAFARVHAEAPAARLRVLGGGPLAGELSATAAQLGVADAVTFCGHVGAERIEAELARAWAVVVPSLWAEPLGMTAIEAIVRGVPVVASATGGLAETVDPGAGGLLFRNGDEDSLVARLREIVAGSRFPSRSVAETEALRLRANHSLTRHTALLRGMLENATVAAA